MSRWASSLTFEVKRGCGRSQKWVRYNDGTVMEIVWPHHAAFNRFVYKWGNGNVSWNPNRWRRPMVWYTNCIFQWSTFQDWTFYVHSGLETDLESVRDVYGYQYWINGYGGNTYRPILDIPIFGSSVNADQKACNIFISVEWIKAEDA